MSAVEDETVMKIIRTPKEWTETCRECNGAGHVHKTQRFSLWTPDEYDKIMPDEHKMPKLLDKNQAPPDAMICVAHAGSSINETCREGIELANMVKRPVAFEHNETLVVCRPGDDLDAVVRSWWERHTGKTYEQIMADR